MSENRTARLVTDTLSPVYLVALVLLVIGWHADQNLSGTGWGLFAALFCAGLPYTFILLGIRRGKWTDRHVRIRRQRTIPLLAAMLSVLVGIAFLVFLGAPKELLALVTAMLTGLVLTLLVTTCWKVSIHTAVAGGVAVVLTIALGPWAALSVFGVALVGWSRITLRDHTPAQVVAGAALGALAAALVFTTMR
ncbi:phosphatase PAP2 family protein [Streptomyces sp. RFCAC02]|uniref:phosphatase PAP2 family protein n=1 Tax=Streptomyces sp. RFCAC02 TaxID=2499143 RepID=UPI0010213663|nr:phosphatase PAP2 family protein [Streptomyces sp. RFCAC02]